ncbi:hypothetical protein DMC61_39075 [Amycolatopsis sp. WAC 04169]|nr:hypothetical protein DMC61_39075 [Amycolatopsis sp. WAC 04169]
MREGITSGFRPVAAHWSGSPQFVSGGRDRKSHHATALSGTGPWPPPEGFPRAGWAGPHPGNARSKYAITLGN